MKWQKIYSRQYLAQSPYRTPENTFKSTGSAEIYGHYVTIRWSVSHFKRRTHFSWQWAKDRLTVHHRANTDTRLHTLPSTPSANFVSAMNLTSKCLDCERKPEHPEEIQTVTGEHATLHREVSASQTPVLQSRILCLNNSIISFFDPWAGRNILFSLSPNIPMLS